MATSAGNVASPPGSGADGFLEIRNAQGVISRIPLDRDQMTIGRIDTAAINLNDPTVSRRHAELFRDPFGRWWVRDLGSVNGTKIQGVRIDERVLNSGDTFRVGSFDLTLLTAAKEDMEQTMARPARPSQGAMPVADAGVASVSGLHEMEPPKISAEHLSTVMKFGKELLQADDADERMKMLAALMIRQEFHGWSSVPIRVQKANPDAPPDMLCDPVASPQWSGVPHISRTLLRVLRQTTQPVVASNVGGRGSSNLELSISADVMGMSAIACPLHSDDYTIDVLYVVLPPEYGTGEWLALAALAVEMFQQSEFAWEARKQAQAHAAIEGELERARQIQLGLVPSDLRVDGVDLGIGFKPCKWVGGDYVDVVVAPDGRVLLAIADVCGKGMPAALVTHSVHTLVHSSISAGASVEDMMNSVNEYLCDFLPDYSFVTMCSVMVDRATGRLQHVNAGHPPAMIVGADGNVRHMPSGMQLALGIAPMPSVCHEEDIQPGEMLSLYTDGLTELANVAGDMLGLEELANYLRTTYGDPKLACERCKEKLNELLDAFQGTAMPTDDRTFLLAKLIPGQVSQYRAADVPTVPGF